MKILVSTVLLYVFILSVFIGFSIIYNQPALLIFIFAFILLAPVSILVFKKAYKSFSFNLSSKTTYVETDNDINFDFSYSNKSKLPLFTSVVIFHVENRYFPNNATQNLSIPLSRSSNSFTIPVKTDNIGLVTMRIEKIIIRDYLCIIQKEFTPGIELSVPVIPHKSSVVSVPPIVPKDGLDEFVESDYKGNISSDIKEIREYRPGDRLQHVHWKLSAKLDDLFVKEMSHTSTLSIVLLPELNRNDINHTIATLVSCIDILNSRGDRFELCCFNQKAFEFTRFFVTDEETLIEALTFLYCQPLYEGNNIALDAFNLGTDSNSTVIHILGRKITIGE